MWWGAACSVPIVAICLLETICNSAALIEIPPLSATKVVYFFRICKFRPIRQAQILFYKTTSPVKKYPLPVRPPAFLPAPIRSFFSKPPTHKNTPQKKPRKNTRTTKQKEKPTPSVRFSSHNQIFFLPLYNYYPNTCRPLRFVYLPPKHLFLSYSSLLQGSIGAHRHRSIGTSRRSVQR